jgi:hypothetical protein
MMLSYYLSVHLNLLPDHSLLALYLLHLDLIHPIILISLAELIKLTVIIQVTPFHQLNHPQLLYYPTSYHSQPLL